MELLDTAFLGNSLLDWASAVGLGIVVLSVLWLLRSVLLRKLADLESRSDKASIATVVSTLRSTNSLVLVVIGVYAGTRLLDISPRIFDLVGNVLVIALLIQGGIWLVSALGVWLQSFRKQRLESDPAVVTTVSAIGFVGKIVIWSAVVLLILENLGIDITALVAGLGIGGIAVALAVQNILGDLFASLSIVLDKPFVLGDFLIIGEHMGSVEHIGLKTTRIRSLSGEQLVFSNSDLLGSRIRNYGRLQERRVVFSIGVTYQTPHEKLEAIPGILRESVEAGERVRFDRAHFKEYGNFALLFEVVYYVLDPDYALYMDIQQAINLRVHERFMREGIEFAYPTQTVFLAREPG